MYIFLIGVERFEKVHIGKYRYASMQPNIYEAKFGCYFSTLVWSAKKNPSHKLGQTLSADNCW